MWDDFVEFFGNAFGVRVAIGAGQAEQGAVMSDAAEVDAPCVDTDGIQWNMPLAQVGQALEEMFVDAVDIPIVFASDFEGLVRETIDLFHREAAVLEGAEDGPSTGGTTVEGEETMGI